MIVFIIKRRRKSILTDCPDNEIFSTLKWRDATRSINNINVLDCQWLRMHNILSIKECIINKLKYGYYTFALVLFSTSGNFRPYQIQTAYVPFRIETKRHEHGHELWKQFWIKKHGQHLSCVFIAKRIAKIPLITILIQKWCGLLADIMKYEWKQAHII